MADVQRTFQRDPSMHLIWDVKHHNYNTVLAFTPKHAQDIAELAMGTTMDPGLFAASVPRGKAVDEDEESVFFHYDANAGFGNLSTPGTNWKFLDDAALQAFLNIGNKFHRVPIFSHPAMQGQPALMGFWFHIVQFLVEFKGANRQNIASLLAKWVRDSLKSGNFLSGLAFLATVGDFSEIQGLLVQLMGNPKRYPQPPSDVVDFREMCVMTPADRVKAVLLKKPDMVISDQVMKMFEKEYQTTLNQWEDADKLAFKVTAAEKLIQLIKDYKKGNPPCASTTVGAKVTFAAIGAKIEEFKDFKYGTDAAQTTKFIDWLKELSTLFKVPEACKDLVGNGEYINFLTNLPGGMDKHAKHAFGSDPADDLTSAKTPNDLFKSNHFKAVMGHLQAIFATNLTAQAAKDMTKALTTYEAMMGRVVGMMYGPLNVPDKDRQLYTGLSATINQHLGTTDRDPVDYTLDLSIKLQGISDNFQQIKDDQLIEGGAMPESSILALEDDKSSHVKYVTACKKKMNDADTTIVTPAPKRRKKTKKTATPATPTVIQNFSPEALLLHELDTPAPAPPTISVETPAPVANGKKPWNITTAKPKLKKAELVKIAQHLGVDHTGKVTDLIARIAKTGEATFELCEQYLD